MSEQDKARDKRLRFEYQITLDERNQLLTYQEGRCAICKKFEKDMKISLSLDHSHQTGLIRGLLCLRCNKAIEMLNCDPEACAAASKYLTKPPFVVLFGERYTAIGKVGSKARRKRLAKMRANEKGISKKKKRTNKSSKKQKSIR